MKVTVTLDLPGRSRAEALRRASDKLNAAAWDYPDRIADTSSNDVGERSRLTARCELLGSLSSQLAENVPPRRWGRAQEAQKA